jgi:alpha-ribazole phosphatase
LLRHGEPEGAGRLLGHGNARPHSAGVEACLARTSGLAVEQVVSSDLSRAQVPAKAIAKALGIPHRGDARWRELNFGHWEGCDPADLPQAQVQAFWSDPQTCPPPGGEDWLAILARVEKALCELDRSTLVVTHAGAIRAALAFLFGWSHRQSWALALPYAALASLTIWPGEPSGAQITGLVT